jgi:Ca-activated chloride channel family protein
MTGSFVLVWPWMLVLLPLPWLARRWLPAAQPAGGALRIPFLAALPHSEQTAAAPMPRFAYLLAWLAWALLVFATARPEWLGPPLDVPANGRDLMLAVDISGSMEQEDYEIDGRPASRLDIVKAISSRFIERREGDRLGLILFGTRAYLQTPLTFDRATVDTMLKEAVIGLAGRDTAIGDAIVIGVKRLRDAVPENRVLILLTDGANTAGNMAPLEAARLAKESQVRIYTIGIGGGSVGSRTPFGTLTRRRGDLDPKTLQAVAEMTGGRFFESQDSEQLDEIYRELDRLEPSQHDARPYRPMRALYYWPGAAALLLCTLLVGVTLARSAHARA